MTRSPIHRHLRRASVIKQEDENELSYISVKARGHAYQ